MLVSIPRFVASDVVQQIDAKGSFQNVIIGIVLNRNTQTELRKGPVLSPYDGQNLLQEIRELTTYLCKFRKLSPVFGSSVLVIYWIHRANNIEHVFQFKQSFMFSIDNSINSTLDEKRGISILNNDALQDLKRRTSYSPPLFFI
jgi:hypothetical protein